MQKTQALGRLINSAATIATVLAATFISSAIAQSADKVVVAHRGASGYLPEHTLPAKAMAYAMDADYIEQDVVMTKDEQLIVIHDITLDRTTDVAEKFPSRARSDGKFYAVDFTLAEILTLDVSEGFTIEDGQKMSNYPQRFPVGASHFKIHTLAQEIELVQGLNHATGSDVGIYPEIKSPEFHLAEGKDLSRAVLEVLRQYGYTSKDDNVFVQTFDFDELKRIHDDLMPALGIDLKLVALLSDGEQNDWQQSAEGLKEIARYADGIGPEKSMIVSRDSTGEAIMISDLVKIAHDNGLQVHPYTYRLDTGQIPPYADSFEQMLKIHLFDAGVDGVFTDFPDRAVDFLRSH
ncbi:MAG: glycerophosphodiester phosphodiesterase [Pseudohongiellaceae bacterium]|nr:glycerophosphodiester phosphodiesterase [Pseudohongiellaceae bacterium]